MTVDLIVIPSNTPFVKIAISVPDPVFADVEGAVARLGVSRSEFFATAARRYLDELDRGSLTASVNEAVALLGGSAGDDATRGWMADAARRTFDREEW
jgi:hypothetical protein